MRHLCQWTLALGLVASTGCGRTPEPAAGVGEVPGAAGTLRAAAVGHLQAPEARGFLASHPEALVLDVRQPDEWDDDLGHIDGARQIPLPELRERLGEIAEWKEKPVVVVCRVGQRSRRGAELLAGAGFRQVMNLEGGMEGWRQSEGAAP